MTQETIAVNLQAATFPLLSQYSGKNVLTGRNEQIYVPGVNVDGQEPVDKGVASLIYCHNVMPTDRGWQSVGFKEIVPTTGIPEGYLLRQIFKIYGTEGVLHTLGIFFDGFDLKVFIIEFNVGNWQEITAPVFSAGQAVSVANIDGRSLICFPGTGVFEYDDSLSDLNQLVLTGIVDANINFIIASKGYLLVFNFLNQVAWSSTVDPLDFVPSEVTGAGGGSIQQARGNVFYGISTNLGFVVYCEQNAVSVLYSGNIDFPWIFDEIPGAGGLEYADLLTEESAGGFHYAYTTSGLQQVTHTGAKSVFPFLSDFISGRRIEDFNEVTNQLTVTDLVVGPDLVTDQVLRKKLTIINERFLVISYGIPVAGTQEYERLLTPMTHALVIDISRGRMGKLKYTHCKPFEFVLNDGPKFGTNRKPLDLPRDGFQLATQEGKIVSVDFRPNAENSSGVMITGKYQYIRTRNLHLNKVQVESVEDIDNFECLDLYTLDGKTFQPAVEGYLYTPESAGLSKSYLFDAVGINHSLLFKGGFNLDSLVLTFTVHGRF